MKSKNGLDALDGQEACSLLDVLQTDEPLAYNKRFQPKATAHGLRKATVLHPAGRVFVKVSKRHLARLRRWAATCTWSEKSALLLAYKAVATSIADSDSIDNSGAPSKLDKVAVTCGLAKPKWVRAAPIPVREIR